MLRTLAALFLLVLLLASPCAAPAEEISAVSDRHPDLLYTISPGLGGRARLDRWTPVRVRLTNPRQPLVGRLELTHVLTDGSTARHHLDVDLPAGSTKEFTLYFTYSGNVETRLALEREDGRWVFAHELRFEAVGILEEHVVAVVGDRSYGVSLTTPPPAQGEGLQPRVRYVGIVVPLGDAPDRWLGWDAVDTVVLARPPGDFPSSRHARALVDWVRAGNHLVLAVGDRWTEFRESEFTPLLPGEPVACEEHGFERDLRDLGFAAGENRGLRCALRNPTGQRLAGEAKTPVILRRDAGTGQVTFLAFDPGRPPFVRAAALERLWSVHALPLAPPAPTDANRYYGSESDPVASWMEGSPLGHRFGSGWLIFTLVVYFLVLGVADYFLLRSLRKLDWMWATMAGWVVLFTLVCWGLSEYGRERETVDRTLRVIDVGEDGSLRGRSMVCLYSPIAATFDVVGATPGFAVRHHEERNRWGASRGGGALLGDIRGVLRMDDPMALRGLRLHRGMMATLVTDWIDFRPEEAAPIEADVDGDRLGIRNSGARPILALAIVSAEKAWALPSLAPGESTRIDLGRSAGLELSPQSVQGFGGWGSPDNQWISEVANRVAQLSAFDCGHRLWLERNKQRYWYSVTDSGVVRDLSPLLRQGRLVVLAAVEAEAPELAIRGARRIAQSLTIFRLVVAK